MYFVYYFDDYEDAGLEEFPTEADAISYIHERYEKVKSCSGHEYIPPISDCYAIIVGERLAAEKLVAESPMFGTTG